MLHVIWSEAMQTAIHTASYPGRRKCSISQLWKTLIMNRSSQISGHSFHRPADHVFPESTELDLCCKKQRGLCRSTGTTSRYCQTRGKGAVVNF